MNDDAQSPETTSAPVARRRANRARRVQLMIVVPLIAALAVGLVYLHGGRYVETDNAYVKADEVPISTEVPGKIEQVLVAENQAVKAGQVLFRIDPAPFEVAVARAEADLAQVRTDLAATRASFREKQAEIKLARTRYDFALKNQHRQADLIAKKFISASGFDDAEQNTELARQQIEALEQALRQIAVTLGGSIDTPVEGHPRFLAAKARLDQARLDLERTEVRAPQAGTVSKVPKPGQYLKAGSTALVLVGDRHLWIEANFTETDLTYVRPGQRVTIRIDTYPHTQWTGSVQSLSPATGAEFSIIPAQNATGNWVKIIQRVPVRISFDAASGKPPLRAGLSAVVEIDTGHKRKLFGLTL